MAQKILVVDDEPDIIEFVSYNLQKEGYSVVTARNGKEAIAQAIKEQPDLVLLDVMMPEMDGIEVCAELRKLPNLKHTVIAFLTARNEDYTQIAGFDAGGDDYIAKPIRPRVLISRIQALLRRRSVAEEDTGNTIITLGDVVINKQNVQVFVKGVEIVLARKEFELLWLLATKPSKVFTRDEIYSSIWGNDVIVGNRTIDVHIRKIREKIGDEYIKTIKGIGYKYE